MEQQSDRARLLPDDALAGVLGRLAPHDLAASRSVCKAWRSIIDDRRILRAELLPRSLAGIFINYMELKYSEFFCRPQPPPDGLGVRERIAHRVEDHCNGLLLLYSYVVNPVTGWAAPLPPKPPRSPGMERFFDDAYLAFDPAVSPHYQVFLVPRVPYIELDMEPDEEPIMDEFEPAVLASEWPPSSYVLRVFSSMSGRWEEKTFMRQGPSAGTVADLATDDSWDKRHAVYWCGALYVHCEKYFVIRLSLSDSTYQVIKPPPGILESGNCQNSCYLGKSEKGVYYAFLLRDSWQLQVWVLKESCGYAEWVLQHDKDLGLLLPHINYRQAYGPWILQDVNYNEEKYIPIYNDNESPVVDDSFEWSSDNDVQDIEDMVDKAEHNCVLILGLHPFKEIVFLSSKLSRGLAYHLNTSKLEDLGSLYPKYYNEIVGPRGLTESSFVYTPCWLK